MLRVLTLNVGSLFEEGWRLPFRRADDAGRIMHCELVADHPLPGVQASDHCGVIADIVWPSRPT